MITVTFACGHAISVNDNTGWEPVCHTCHETRVSRVKARAPHFYGTATGPYCETKGLEPGIVNVAPGGPLSLRESS